MISYRSLPVLVLAVLSAFTSPGLLQAQEQSQAQPVAVQAADAARPASNNRPNVIVIVADDLGYGDVGCYGGSQIPTPAIDGLARSGVRCRAGYVSGPYCSPTRAGLLTGRYQQRFGHEFNPGGGARTPAAVGLRLDQKTLADRMKAQGYVTALVGKWHLGGADPFHPQKRGFDEFFGFLGGAHGYFTENEPGAPILRGTEAVTEPEYLTHAFTREAVAFIERNQSKPFFLYLAFNAVHTPMQAPEEIKQHFSTLGDPRRRTYAAMLTAMDNGIGKVLARLKELQLEKNTLVVFFSDNGGPTANGSSNGPLNGQKATTWEGGIRVPFIWSWPGRLPENAEYGSPIIQLDVVPTVLAAAGAPIPESEKLDGVNLLPTLTDPSAPAPHETLYWRFGEQMALRQGPWKLIRVRGDEQPRLYHLDKDLGEKNNLAEAEPDKVKELHAIWNRWNDTLEPPAWRPAPNGPNGKAKKKARNNAL